MVAFCEFLAEFGFQFTPAVRYGFCNRKDAPSKPFMHVMLKPALQLNASKGLLFFDRSQPLQHTGFRGRFGDFRWNVCIEKEPDHKSNGATGGREEVQTNPARYAWLYSGLAEALRHS